MEILWGIFVVLYTAGCVVSVLLGIIGFFRGVGGEPRDVGSVRPEDY